MSSELKRDWSLKNEVVYGPFATRRKGQSLGINVLAMGEKFCSFNCLYCQCGFTRGFDPETTPAEAYLDLGLFEEAVNDRFAEVAAGPGADTIVLSGNGEPTLHPQFDQVIDILRAARAKHLPDIEIQCLSAGTELHRDEVIAGLNKIDRPIMKMDAADPALVKKIDRPLVPFSLETYANGLARLESFWLQTCFFTGPVGNFSAEALEFWFDFVGSVRPAGVEIYSIYRKTPAKSLEAVALEELERVGAELKSRHGIDSLVV